MSDNHNKAESDANDHQNVEANPASEDSLGLGATSAEIDRVEALISEWKSKASYMAAELENMKKRFARDRVETIKFANESLLKLVVPVLDNLSLALNSSKGIKDESSSSPLVKALVEGVEMTVKHFEQTLSQAGVEFIESAGQAFDPEIHEAVGQAQDTSKTDGLVLNEVQRGFKLSGRVVRTAKVIVNKIS